MELTHTNIRSTLRGMEKSAEDALQDFTSDTDLIHAIEWGEENLILIERGRLATRLLYILNEHPTEDPVDLATRWIGSEVQTPLLSNSFRPRSSSVLSNVLKELKGEAAHRFLMAFGMHRV